MHPHQRSSFGIRLRQFRQEAAISQEELAERAGLSLRGVSDLERGARTTPRLETVRMLAHGLGLTDIQRSELIAARSLLEPKPPGKEPVTSPDLPVPSNAFIGRTREIDHILQVLAQHDTRLLTLTGPGGVGKTRLAIEIAHRARSEYTGGGLYVDLAPVRDAGMVLSTIAARIGVIDQRGSDPREALRIALEQRNLLLVLDNLEQVITSAKDISWLLETCPRLTVLTTSRIVLRISAEKVLEIEPLSNPEIENPGDMDLSDSVLLFVSRANAADSRFELDGENFNSVMEIVSQLQGMPLAIELAAARLRLWPVDMLATHLKRQLPILTSGANDAPERHRTMRDTVAWSYDLLSPEVQSVMRAMSIFPVGCTLETVTDLFDHETLPAGTDILQAMSTLVDSSLVRAVEGADGAVRYRMLFVVQEFGLEQLAGMGEYDIVRLAAHENWCVPLSNVAEFVSHRPDARYWLNRIGAEYENVRNHIDWLIARDYAEKALDIVVSLQPYVRSRHRFGVRTELLKQLLSHPNNQGDTAARMKGLVHIGDALSRQRPPGEQSTFDTFATAEKIARYLHDDHYLMLALNGFANEFARVGDFDVSESYEREVIAIAESINAPGFIADATLKLGMIARFRGLFLLAKDLGEQAINLFEAIDDILGNAYAKISLAPTLQQMGELDQAERLLNEAHAVYDAHGMRALIPQVFNELGAIHVQRNSLKSAKQLLEQGRNTARELGYIYQEAYGADLLAWVAVREGDYETAKSIVHPELKRRIAENDALSATDCMVTYADLLICLGDLPQAAWLLGAAEKVVNASGASCYEYQTGEHQERLDKITTLMGQERYQYHHDRGFNLTEDEILIELRSWLSVVDSQQTPSAPEN